MSTRTATECGTCRAPIIWAVTVHGRRMPVDADPAADGNITLDLRGGPMPLARVLTTAQRFGRRDLHKCHFATCPHAAAHRRRPQPRTSRFRR